MTVFDYDEAFSRTLGWVTEHELHYLKSRRIAIAGLGGVGGDHLLTLVRLGIGKFHIADLDHFELVNFNRQAGAGLSTLGVAKVTELARRALDVNPDLELVLFPEGVTAANLNQFLEGVDICVDALDVFAIDIREQLFKSCEAKGISVVSAAPIGMGTSVICFTPSSMSYRDYFGWKQQSAMDKIRLFLIGISPYPTAMKYLVDKTRMKLDEHRTASTPMGIDLAAGILCSVVLKLLLKRGPVIIAPRTVHFDVYLNHFKIRWRPWGARNPLQQIAYWYIRRVL